MSCDGGELREPPPLQRPALSGPARRRRPSSLPIATILFSVENSPAGTGGAATKIRVTRCFAEEGADTPAVLEVEVSQGDVPSADEILSFASMHGDFVSIPDRIFHRFEILLPPESRLEILKDALLQVVYLERDGSGGEGLNPYEVEDLIDALERARQNVPGGDAAP